MDIMTIAEALVRDNEYVLPDGRVLRFTDEQDTDTSLNDFECWGRVEYVASPWDSNGQRAERPTGFDGRAEKIVTAYGDTYWWQPTLELWGVDAAEWHANADLRRRNRREVTDILTYGFRLFTVEVFRPCAECGTEKLEDWDATGGMEAFMDDAEKACAVDDLLFRLIGE